MNQRNHLALAAWVYRRNDHLAAGTTEPDLRNAEQRKRGGRIRAHLFILRYVLKRSRRGI